MDTLTFGLFSDLHYKKNTYPTAVAHLEHILDRAASEAADFVMHCGDFCNDHAGSPELIRAWLDNPHGLDVYGILGNHDLEGRGNTLASVRRNLTNRPVVWGTENAGYFFFDRGAFRVIGLDAGYSLCESTGLWVHNPDGGYGAPRGNAHPHSLGPAQLAWLEEILTDAASNGLHCLIFSHASASPAWRHYSDADALHELFVRVNARRAGTVFAMFNGHYHTSHAACVDHVLYYDVNAVISGAWRWNEAHHYAPGHTYRFTDYDAAGNPLGSRERPLIEIGEAITSWFYNDPLSAMVTVSDDGRIRVRGAKTSWMHGILPHVDYDGCMPEIPDLELTLF
ncbi:MAG: metallophosphoesterase [Clostridia bacterium]|nr:metallophosphoesterase [Clostridia bacterium]